MSFLRCNGIVGDLRDDILDYFEFRYSNNIDLYNDKVLLNHLPTEMQALVVHRIFPNALNPSYIFNRANEGFVAQCLLHICEILYRRCLAKLSLLRERLAQNVSAEEWVCGSVY